MSQKTLWRVVLVGLLCVALATPAHAAGCVAGAPVCSIGANIGLAVGIVAAVAVAVVVVVVVTHKKKITGCATASDKGLSITDESDKQNYVLSGNPADIKAGERVRLQVKKVKSTQKGGAPTWQVEKLVKDYGACHP